MLVPLTSLNQFALDGLHIGVVLFSHVITWQSLLQSVA
jgi:hypothetical protein